MQRFRSCNGARSGIPAAGVAVAAKVHVPVISNYVRHDQVQHSRLKVLSTQRLALDQALALLREWQEDLRLIDWHIKLSITPAMAPRHGHVRICEPRQCAYIRLLDHSAAIVECEPLDMEVALVHELLHIHFAAFIQRDKRTHKDVIQEQSIHKQSILLVSMKRQLRACGRKRAA